MTSTLPVNGLVNPTGAPTVNGETVLAGAPLSSDKNKEWQMELLMEKLRSKQSSYKTLVETAKNIRMTMLDKRFGIDSIEKSQLQKSLDALQHSIKVTSLQSMIERLESLSRQLGLKFMMTGSTTGTSTDLFISSDMFYLEVLLEPSGAVKDVKIHHEGKAEQQSCEELVACLSKGDFVDFTTQLEGLASIYQLNADKKVKCKAFSALQSLENDLGVLAQLQTFIKEPFNLVHKSPVGVLERRKGGHAMKLTYFVSPYDLIDKENKSCEILSVEAVISKKVGQSVTVCMEGSTAHKLPTSSIISVTRGPTGKSTPSYAPLTSANSSMLPACFVLKLAKKMPMCLELVRRIQKVTELECTDVSSVAPLLSMIVQHASDKQLDCRNNKGLSVSLPDQQHCYFMTENHNMEGVLVGSIPFTHPAHVPQILVYLRQQALFNTLISSCVRPMARHNFDLTTTIFEVSALSWQCISVSLEHPFEETLATAELDLSDISAVKCKLYGASSNNCEQTSEIAGKVLQRCLSVPLTMRTLIKAWEGRTFTLNSSKSNSNGSNYNNSMNQSNGQPPQQNGTNGPEFEEGDIKIKQEPGVNNSGRQQQNINQQQQQSFLDAGAENSIGFPAFSGSTDMTSSTVLDAANKKVRKRKLSEISVWKSPTVKDIEPGEIVLESSSSDSTPLGTPKEDARTPTPTSIDLSNIDTLEVISTDKSSDCDVESVDTDFVQIEPTYEKRAKKEKPSAASVIEDTKALVSPSVSITPITNQSSNFNSMLSSMGLERRPGIEIIPITSLTQTQLPSSITITAITNPNKLSSVEDRTKIRKSGKVNKSIEDKSKLEKKRKRKRDSSPTMGPPAPLKQQDPLSKPVSVSIKPASESPPTSRPTSPALRKFSPSPTHGIVILGKSSPTPGLRQSPVGAGRPSPKHSPVYSSPKHMSPLPGSSPKHGTLSPKHGNSSSSGKPSMSALKSASTSPKGDTPKIKTPPSISPSSSPSVTLSSLPSVPSGANPNKDKERKPMVFGGSSPGHQSPKSKTASKVKVSDVEQVNRSDSATPPDPNKSLATLAQARNRKGSLSAVIDKLKNAQHCSDDIIIPTGSAPAPTVTAPVKSGDAKNPTEYMVKPSSDGMKLTINKTRTKDSKGNSGVGTKPPNVGTASSAAGSSTLMSLAGNGASKTYTGLKPGVVAGPASKKSQAQNLPKVRSVSPLTPSTSKNNPSSVQKLGIKSSSSSNLLSSSSSVSSSSNLANKSSLSKSFTSLSSKQGLMTTTDIARAREKARLKTGEKSFSTKESESEKAFKLLAAHASSISSGGLPAQLVVEGLMKQLDTNFQIPKLSARTNPTEAEKRSVDKVDGGTNKTLISSKIEDSTSVDVDVPTNLSMQSDIQTKAEISGTKKFLSNSDVETKESSQSNQSGNIETLNLASKSAEKDQGFHQVAQAEKKPTTFTTKQSSVSQEAAEMLLDFSAPKDVPVMAAITYGPSSSPVRKNTTPPPLPPPPPPLPPPLQPLSTAVSPLGFPHSPSVSLHIVKSPAPSPRVIPLSPHSASPCITDDELMDEALVGS